MNNDNKSSHHQVLPIPSFKTLCVCAESLQSCLTLCYPVDCNPPDSSVHGLLQARITGIGFHALFQGVVPIQGLNLCLSYLLHCQEYSLPLVPPGKPSSCSVALNNSFLPLPLWVSSLIPSLLGFPGGLIFCFVGLPWQPISSLARKHWVLWFETCKKNIKHHCGHCSLPYPVYPYAAWCYFFELGWSKGWFEFFVTSYSIEKPEWRWTFWPLQ